MKYSNKRKTKSPNPKTRKNKLHKTKTRKVIKKTGGVLLGSGSFGEVYAAPRIPCVDETNESVKDLNEASKIFKYEEYASDEIGVLDRFDGKIPIEELQQYAILPIKKCDIHKDALVELPYSNGLWPKDKYGHYASITGMGADTYLPDMEPIYDKYGRVSSYDPIYKSMIIQPRGGETLHTIFYSIKSDESFKECLLKLTGIAKGIQILQRHNFFHGDIKPGNCVEHEKIFKLIDMADCRDITTSFDTLLIAQAFGYFVRPPTCIYTSFFDESLDKKSGPIDSTSEIQLTLGEIQKYYNKLPDFNHDSFINYVKPALVDSFVITKANGFSEEPIMTAKKYSMNLYSQKKLYGLIDIHNKNITIDSFKPLFKDTFNDIFKKDFTSPLDAKLDIFKRIDIYSFGIMILECIRSYINWKNKLHDKRINKNIKVLIMNLYKLAYDCCIQLRKCYNFDNIVDRYCDLMRPLLTEFPELSTKYASILMSVTLESDELVEDTTSPLPPTPPLLNLPPIPPLPVKSESK